MYLSLTKNLIIGLNDISEFIKECKSDCINLKDVLKYTTNQNIYENKKIKIGLKMQLKN